MRQLIRICDGRFAQKYTIQSLESRNSLEIPPDSSAFQVQNPDMRCQRKDSKQELPGDVSFGEVKIWWAARNAPVRKSLHCEWKFNQKIIVL
jgi:hypothetical protein